MLTSNDLALLIPIIFFAVYAAWITAEVLSVREQLEVEERNHEGTQSRLDKEYRLTRLYRQTLQFYALEENWDPLHNPLNLTPRPKGSKIAADQGQTAQLALGNFFLSPNADQLAPVLNLNLPLPEGEETSLGKYFYQVGPNKM